MKKTSTIITFILFAAFVSPAIMLAVFNTIYNIQFNLSNYLILFVLQYIPTIIGILFMWAAFNLTDYNVD